MFDKLLLNFTWWVNLEDADGSNLFEGGFLGLDNIGPLDRSHLPAGSVLEQSDATGWMAGYALAMGVDRDGPAARRGSGPPTTWCTSSSSTSPRSATRSRHRGCGTRPTGCSTTGWPSPDGEVVPVEVRSMVGIIPMLAAGVVDEELLDRAQAAGKQFADFLDRSGLRDREQLAKLGLLRGEPGRRQLLLGVVGHRPARAAVREAVRSRPSSSPPYGLRSLSAYHREHPYVLDAPGVHARRSTTNPPSRPRRCSAATPTGADRSGSR